MTRSRVAGQRNEDGEDREVRRHRSLEEGTELAKEIYAISNEGPFARDFGLRDQIRRAAVSVMSNIAEGFERGGDVEFRRCQDLPRVGSSSILIRQGIMTKKCWFLGLSGTFSWPKKAF